MTSWSRQDLTRIVAVVCFCLSVVALGRAGGMRLGMSGERQLREVSEKAALDAARVALAQVELDPIPWTV